MPSSSHIPPLNNIVLKVLETVLLCHNRGVLHRDLKDENILIDPRSKQIRLIDFGSGTYLIDGLYNDFEGRLLKTVGEDLKVTLESAGWLHHWLVQTFPKADAMCLRIDHSGQPQ